jgi:AraC-like DNA-binding protein
MEMVTCPVSSSVAHAPAFHNAVLTPTSPAPHGFYRSTGESRFEFVRPALGSFELVAASEAQAYPKHQHNSYQLIFAQRGRYRCVLNGSSLELQPRDLLVVKRGDWHEEIVHPSLRYFAVNFDLSDVNDTRKADLLFTSDIDPEQQIIRGPNDDIGRILDGMLVEARRGDHLVTPIESALMLQLFWSIVRAIPDDRLSPLFRQQSVTRTFEARLRWLFEHHRSDNLSTKDIAAKLGMSVRTLTKRCREILERPPANAFMHYKMEYAAHLLRQSEVAIKEVSHRLGFQNQYHFSRAFRRYAGTAPSHYRGAQETDTTSHVASLFRLPKSNECTDDRSLRTPNSC